MTLLVHVAIPVDNVETIRPVFEQCCKKSGDKIIGRRMYEDVGELLLVVLLEQEVHISQHVPILVQALQQRLILSYQFEYAQMVMLQCRLPACDIRDKMLAFPLQSNESWFPAIHDARMIYTCIRNPTMHPAQEKWLNEQGIDYQYI